MKLNIKIDTIEKIRNWGNMVLHFDEDIKLYSEGYIINAKSLMGIFSLNIYKPMLVEIETSDEKVIEKFNKAVEPFVI